MAWAFRPSIPADLREFGWIEGQNLTFEVLYSEGRAERFPDLAARLVRLNVDLIVAEAAPHPETASGES